MFETIVIGVEGRPQDDEALALARQLGAATSRLVAAHVADPGDGMFGAATPELAAGLLAEGQTLVDTFAAAARGVDAVATSAPSVARGLRHVAHGHRADLVVLGSAHHRLPGRFRSGEALCAIVSEAPCPVAICAPDHHPAPRLREIVVGYDGSARSEAAVELAVGLGRRDGARVTAVEVIEPVLPATPIPGTLTAATAPGEHDRLHADLEHLAERFGLHAVVGVGHAAPVLDEAARTADLLVAGFHDASILERLLRRSTSHALVRDHHVPLLLVPPAAA